MSLQYEYMKDLDELYRLAETATPGPWVFHEGRIRHKALKQEKSFAAHLSIPDGKFIAAAREAVPALITRVRQLVAMIDWLAWNCETLSGYNPILRQGMTKTQWREAAREACQ